MINSKNRYKIFFFSLLIPVILSCATTVKVEIEHPPLVDMSGMETITVIPLEWKNNSNFDFLAGDLTKALIKGVKNSKYYKFVDPAILKNIDKSEYWKYVDVYIDAKIFDVDNEIKTEKTGEKEYAIKTVTVVILYEYISAIDYKVLGSFSKNIQRNEKYDISKPSIADMIINSIVITETTLTGRLALKAVQNVSLQMNYELNPYITTENRTILQSKSKNPLFIEAEKLVRQKKYNDALLLYERIYKETGSTVACYNMALLLEADNKFTEALALLEEFDIKLSNKDINTPSLITKEIKKIKTIISELAKIEDMALSQQYNAQSDFIVYHSTLFDVRGVRINKYVGNKSEVYIPPLIGNLPVVRIEEKAFKKEQNITVITIPDSVKIIDSYAFADFTSLVSVNIPKNLVWMGPFAFRNCTSLTGVNIPKSIEYIQAAAFINCISLTDVTIEEGVISIGRFAFENCKSLTRITIPDSVTELDREVFKDCVNLVSINIPNGVKRINISAFEGCESLTSIIIPKSVWNISPYAFSGCTNLTSVTFEGEIFVHEFYNDNSSTFPGDLREKFYAVNKEYGTPGTYTRKNSKSTEWTKKP
jgi:hypothetical protein